MQVTSFRLGAVVLALAWAGVARADDAPPAEDAPAGTASGGAADEGEATDAATTGAARTSRFSNGASAVSSSGDARAAEASASARAGEVSDGARAAASPGDLDLRLTLSSFLFRELGDDAPPLVENGAPVPSASPVRRFFGDLRIELAGSGLALDARVRQTSSQRYQAGASAGGEYDIRTLSFRLGSERTALVLGRQFVDAVGATKIDGIAAIRRVSPTWSATAFAGTYPQLGSRSLDTDYPAVQNPDGSEGSPLIPVAGGLGASYMRPSVHGDLGVAAVYVAQEVEGATSEEASRVFATTSGYARPARWVDVYHLGMLDLAGQDGLELTNGSLGLNVHPASNLQISASVNHVSTNILQIAARNQLADPDPTALGIVQNNIAVIRVSQDLVRAGTSLALADARFEIALSGGLHRRPAVAVELADGGSVSFPLARSADATLMVLDRRSVAGLRASATASLTFPVGDNQPNRARGAVARLAAERTFADGRGEVEVDVMAQRYEQVSSGGMCTSSLDVFACYGASKMAAAQAGVLASWQAAREWLVLVDTHVGVQDVESVSIDQQIIWPRVTSLTVFARAQWRYR